MPKFNHQLLVRAGRITMTVLLIVAAVVIIPSVGWVAWNYFSHPATQTVSSNNGSKVSTTIKTVPHTVNGFFAAVADAWRPNTKVYAQSNGRTLTEYPYNLATGPLPNTTVFTLSDESTPDVNANVNGGSNTNSVVNADTNSANTNGSADTNTATNANQNTNSGLGNTNVSPTVNSNQNTNSSLNVNSAPAINDNTNSVAAGNTNAATNTHTDLNANTNSATNQNVNEAVLPINGNVNSEPVNENVATNTSTNTAPVAPVTTEVLTAENWYRQAPKGQAILKVNWFCSAALTHLTTTTDGQQQLLGDFTGDCTNTSVSVKGNFVPQLLGSFDPAKPLSFTISSELQMATAVSHTTADTGECTVDYIQHAGAAGVYAVQYTCDDGYGLGRTVAENTNSATQGASANLQNVPIANTAVPTVQPDDIQFTVYIFPNTFTSSAKAIDLLTTADKQSDDDGDGLTYTQELAAKTNPNNADTDADGLGDFEEIYKYKTDPIVADTDGDGYADGAEVAGGYNPLGAGMATAEQLSAWAAAPNQIGKTTISNIQASFATGMMTVTWSVSPNADGIVNWGADKTYGHYQSDYPFAATHSISFPAVAGQTVHYALRSCTPAPHAVCSVSNDLTYVVPSQ